MRRIAQRVVKLVRLLNCRNYENIFSWGNMRQQLLCPCFAGTPVGTVASVLERRVAALEEENKSLRTEAARIVEDVEKTEAEERYLVEDAIAKLGMLSCTKYILQTTLITDYLQNYAIAKM